MRASIPRAFVEPDARDVAIGTRLEFQSKLNCIGVRVCCDGGGGAVIPDTAWTRTSSYSSEGPGKIPTHSISGQVFHPRRASLHRGAICGPVRQRTTWG